MQLSRWFFPTFRVPETRSVGTHTGFTELLIGASTKIIC